MRNKGMTVTEYMVLIAVLAAALVGMQVYVKRSIQGKMRSTFEDFSGGQGYSPGATVTNSVVTRTTNEQTRSYTTRDADDKKISVSEFYTPDGKPFEQTTEKTEELLPEADEPRR